MSDAAWALVRGLLPVPGWLAGRGGRPEGYCHRQMIDAVRYLVDNGIKWRAMPCDFPPWSRVYAFFARWRDLGLAAELHDRPREAARHSEGRKEEPTAGVVGSQSVKADATVTHVSRGFDAGKKINGRKRHLLTDTLGLLLAVLVTAASVSDNAGGIHVLSNIDADHPRITKAWADTGYRTKVIDHGARLGIDVEVTHRDPAQKGFKVIPRRWVVERTFGWLMHHRRLARDYEIHPHRSEAMIKVAMIDLISRRLTRESTPNWRDA